jgi:hypothetical protein
MSRRIRRAFAAVAPAVVLLALAGAAPSGAAPPAAAAARAAPPPVRLTVTFTRGSGPRHVSHLRCTGNRAVADGFLSSVGAARACGHARRIARVLASPPSRRRACTQIYGGPERALVTGTIGARRIRRGFARTDGCRIADWRRAMPLLPRPG